MQTDDKFDKKFAIFCHKIPAKKDTNTQNTGAETFLKHNKKKQTTSTTALKKKGGFLHQLPHQIAEN